MCVLQGQFHNPNGLYFGGTELAEEVTVLVDTLAGTYLQLCVDLDDFNCRANEFRTRSGQG
jgi:hypothetical protein